MIKVGETERLYKAFRWQGRVILCMVGFVVVLWYNGCHLAERVTKLEKLIDSSSQKP